MKDRTIEALQCAFAHIRGQKTIEGWNKHKKHRSLPTNLMTIIILLLTTALTELIDYTHFWHIFRKESNTPVTALQLGGFVIFIIGSAFLIIMQDNHAKRLQETELQRSSQVTRFNDSLDFLFRLLVRFSASEKNDQEYKAFKQDLLAFGALLFSADGIRLALYIFDTDDSEEMPQHMLILDEFAGRGDPPRATFTPKTREGQETITTASGTAPRAIESISESDDRFKKEKNSLWVSFMQFPIRINERPYGTLMVDSRYKIKWGEEHQAIGQTISTLLALGIAQLPGTDPRKSPPKIPATTVTKGAGGNRQSKDMVE